MSIILDALRRADAERERTRGAVPGVHDQTDPGLPPSAASGDEPPTVPARWPAWAWVLGAGVLLLTGAAWWLRTSPSPAPAPLAAAPAEPPPRVVAPPMPTPLPVPTAAAPLPPAARVQPPAAPTPAARASAPPLRMALDADASRAAATLPRLKDLPEALRHELPALRVGGTMYSDSPGASVLVINDQLLREGDSVVPGLLLERIGPKSARLRWKDQRFELPY